MKFIFEQPNLDDLNTNHLYFDCGDGTTVTVFTNENLTPDKTKLKINVEVCITLLFGLVKALFE